jgi:hypothetical protein
MCFWLSTRTMKLGMFTSCLPTLAAHSTARHSSSQEQQRSGCGVEACLEAREQWRG